MPVFAAQIFHGDAHTLGFLMSASGIGALLGALWLAARKSVVGLGRVIPIASALFGAGLITFALMGNFYFALPCLTIAGFGFMVQMASSNTVIQTIVEDEKRGRVMSFYTMAFLGTVPLGSLIAGWLSSKIGAPHTLVVGGICCLIGGGLFARALPVLRTHVRPIYVKLGILTAAELSVPPERN
jgi:MFS family permease